MRLMYDAVNALNIHAVTKTPALVGGYVNGRYAWSAADWALFPAAIKLRFDVTGTAPLASDILDVEPGNLGTPAITEATTPAQVEQIWADLCARAKSWVATRHAHNLGSTCYVQASRKNQLATTLAGLPVVFHMADWGLTEAAAVTLIRGAEVAVQFQNTPGYDVSVVSDAWYPAQVTHPTSTVPTTIPPVAKPKPVLTGITLTLNYSDGTKKTETYT